MLSLLVWPKVNTLSGFNCSRKNDKAMHCSKLINSDIIAHQIKQNGTRVCNYSEKVKFHVKIAIFKS